MGEGKKDVHKNAYTEVFLKHFEDIVAFTIQLSSALIVLTFDRHPYDLDLKGSLM